nr:hypothetical protein [Tanacetum cinerariifolium]
MSILIVIAGRHRSSIAIEGIVCLAPWEWIDLEMSLSAPNVHPSGPSIGLDELANRPCSCFEVQPLGPREKIGVDAFEEAPIKAMISKERPVNNAPEWMERVERVSKCSQAFGIQNPCYLKKAQQLKPNLYNGSVIGKSDVVVVPDSEDTLMHAEESRSKMIEKQNAPQMIKKKETLMLAEEGRSKMIEKQNDPQMIEKKVITKPINYAILNQLSTDFKTRFMPQTESSAEQDFWSQYSVHTDEPNLSGTTIVEVPNELPKVSMVNSCLKKIKFHLASFDMVVKERITATAITEGT